MLIQDDLVQLVKDLQLYRSLDPHTYRWVSQLTGKMFETVIPDKALTLRTLSYLRVSRVPSLQSERTTHQHQVRLERR
jgi:hypothetical protein